MIRLMLAVAFLCGPAMAQTVPVFTGPEGRPAVPNRDAISLNQVTTAIGAKCDLAASACTVTPQGGTASQTLAKTQGKRLQIEAFSGLHADRVTDDAAILQTALNTAVSTGSYVLELGPHGYLVDSANLTIPQGVKLTCSGGRMGEAQPTTSTTSVDYSQLPCTIVLNPSFTILRGAQSVIDGVNVVNKNYMVPATLRQAVNLISLFSGTALTDAGGDAWIRNSTVLGFNNCSINNGQQRERIEHLWGDCTNGVYNSQSHDISRYSDVHLWPFLTVHTSWIGNGNYAIKGFSNNGQGAIRVTWAAPTGPNAPATVEPPVTGDTLFVTTSSDQTAGTYGTEAQGVPYSVHGKWTITVVDGGHFDLQGSTYPSAVGIGVISTAGSSILVAPSPSILNGACGPGMAVSGSGIPSSATVTGVYQNQIVILPAATASGAITATCTPVSGLSGGAAIIDPFYRAGTAFSWDNGEHNTCDHCFDFGHEIGFHFGTRAGWTECDDCSTEGSENQSATSSGFYIAPGAYNTTVKGGYVGSKSSNIALNENTNNPASVFIGVSFGAGSLYTPTINLQVGNIIVTGSTLAANGATGDVAARGSIYLGSSMSTGSAIFSANNFGQAKFQAASPSASATLTQGLNISGGGP